MFIKFLYDFNEAKHGGKETCPPEIITEGFTFFNILFNDIDVVEFKSK